MKAGWLKQVDMREKKAWKAAMEGKMSTNSGLGFKQVTKLELIKNGCFA